MRGSIGIAASEGNEILYRCADSCANIAGCSDTVAGNGRHAGNQRFISYDPVVNCGRRSYVLDDAAHIRGQAAARNFPARDQLNELVFTARWVNARYLFEDDTLITEFGQNLAEAQKRLRLVAFDGEQASIDLQGMHENLCAAQDFRRAFAHQDIVTTDIGLALDAIQNQVLDFTGARLHEFLCGWKDRTSKAHNATVQDS